MFERSMTNEDYGISPQELMNSKLIPERNQQTYREIQRNKGDIQLISINGIILATDLGKAGTSFIPIFDQITTTGNSTTGKMEELLSEMSSDMLEQNLKALENFSKQAIDLIDRNLFERAADVDGGPRIMPFGKLCRKVRMKNSSRPQKGWVSSMHPTPCIVTW